MTDAMTTQLPMAPLQMVGDVDAASCEGDFCVIPEHRETNIVNRRLDDNRV